jgi:endonuclease/exonuclease/phosphatase family metal-dependent hydrolase
MDPRFLDTEYRRTRIMAFLRAQADTAEVVVLQEVQDSEFPYLAEALGSRFAGSMSTNAPDFWSNWVDESIGWAPNGTAVFIRRAAFGTPRFEEIEQTTGNSVAWVTARHLASGKRVRVASVHLDSDSQVNRQVELAAVLDLWGPGNENTVDIIAGDFNEDTVKGSLSLMIERAGFVDVLASLGNREQTHPWIETYYMADKWGVIDHVIARNAVPVSGDVIDSGVWSVEDQTARIEANFDACGPRSFPGDRGGTATRVSRGQGVARRNQRTQGQAADLRFSASEPLISGFGGRSPLLDAETGDRFRSSSA